MRLKLTRAWRSLSKNSSRAARTIGEGCEWDAFWQMAQHARRHFEDALDGVSVLLVELHVCKVFKMSRDADVLMFASFFRYVFLRHGFRLFYSRVNPGKAKERAYGVHPKMAANGADERDCCYELGLARSKDSQDAWLHGAFNRL